MNIIGLQKTTLLDYPGHVAATLFTGGCNFRCPFCHNSDLVLNPGAQSELSPDEIMAFLRKRRGILDGVCITGGEPTLQGDLEAFICEIRRLGYLVKLDTNGYRPEVLKNFLDKGLLDYVAMDVKASEENYRKAVGFANRICGDFRISKIKDSIALLKESSIDYEFRTTVVKGIHTIEEFEVIGRWLQGARAYYLQAFQESENIIALQQRNTAGAADMGGVNKMEVVNYSAFTRPEMEQMAVLAGKYIEKVSIRGLD